MTLRVARLGTLAAHRQLFETRQVLHRSARKSSSAGCWSQGTFSSTSGYARDEGNSLAQARLQFLKIKASVSRTLASKQAVHPARGATQHEPPTPRVKPQENATSSRKSKRRPRPASPEDPTKHGRRPEGRKHPGKTPPRQIRMAQAITRGTPPLADQRRRDGVGDGAPRKACGEGGDLIVADGCA